VSFHLIIFSRRPKALRGKIIKKNHGIIAVQREEARFLVAMNKIN